MLPATLAQDIKRQIQYYLSATFHFRRKQDEEALGRFLNDPEDGIFRGPWVQLQRPFRQAEQSGSTFLASPAPFHPFQHQWTAWKRLTSLNHEPQSTLIATGTGSGKTECFLVPILDHCYRMRTQGGQGIKALILYPMNALATDQAKRFAQAIWKSKPLRDAGVRVGLFIGQGDPSADEDRNYQPKSVMGKDHVIDDREVLKAEPPDILLTNYRMLDYLLLRPADQGLWCFNVADELRYLVLDELHTYDGAQGADVACLIRRFKERLGIARGRLCCVGTSATIAQGEDESDTGPVGKLCDFAGKLFEERFAPDAVIGEDRIEDEAMLMHPQDDTSPLPPARECIPREDEDVQAYTRRIAAVWGGPAFPTSVGERPDPDGRTANETWSLDLGHWVRSHGLFRHLLQATTEPLLAWEDLVRGLSALEARLREAGTFEDRNRLVTAFFALVAEARELRNGRVLPLAPTRVQVWVRELRRLGRVVASDPVFCWLDQPPPNHVVLPTFNCSECGESGWVTLLQPDRDSQVQSRGVNGHCLNSDTEAIYQAWPFEAGKKARPYLAALSPWPTDESEPEQQTLAIQHWYLCPGSLVLRQGPGLCPLSGQPTFRVRFTQSLRRGAGYDKPACPHCGAGGENLFFVGSRSATLCSVAIDEIFGSLLNRDPKLLAFTDSVQDASHRASFFSARTYHFTFRTALKHALDSSGEVGIALQGSGQALLDYWSRRRPGWEGGIDKALMSLIPHDLERQKDFEAYRASGNPVPPATLLANLTERLEWEILSEFGLNVTRGRTLESNACGSLGWDQASVAALAESLLLHVTARLPAAGHLTSIHLTRWVLGLFYRMRERGALSHRYVDTYVGSGRWGKLTSQGAPAHREFFPSFSYLSFSRPVLFADRLMRNHDFILSGGQTPETWAVTWTRRALDLPRAMEAEIIDCLDAFLRQGREQELLVAYGAENGASLHAMNSRKARLYPVAALFRCNHSGHWLVCPPWEQEIWEGAPSLRYHSPQGRYISARVTEQQQYYQDRYRKGALRRIFAKEHTGLLTPKERTEVERRFYQGTGLGDPNVLTATPTLEMGIDIGDLSTTFLCSIPPTTSSYLQRIGRAGRTTGTALVVSIVTQRPHDLYFCARPREMLRGRIQPPGCWIDASAVLSRQYLAYCIDTAVKTGLLEELPKSGKQLLEQMQSADNGFGRLFQWMSLEEAALLERFLARFPDGQIKEDTIDRFRSECRTEALRNRVLIETQQFERFRINLENARKRLREQKGELEPAEADLLRDLEREEGILSAQITRLQRISALELLNQRGLLPNYAFPERGVRLSGMVYQNARATGSSSHAYEVIRGAGMAIKELAPHNTFYTRGHRFEIQQIDVGTPSEPLLARYAICGRCGHMRPEAEMRREEAATACPQCRLSEGPDSQNDVGRQRQCIDFTQSQAISYMDYYGSLASDSSEERNRRRYHLVNSFDPSLDAPQGAVVEPGLPFGIEYRARMALKEVNAGYLNLNPDFPFGLRPDGQPQFVPSEGFPTCVSCGVIAAEGQAWNEVVHRKSCTAARRYEKARREGRDVNPPPHESVFLYRQLESEALHILLPTYDPSELASLQAALQFGLRLKFDGDPADLMLRPQSVPDPGDGQPRQYLILMDAVPGGTGFLKTLYQDQDGTGRPGQGLMDVMSRAKDMLETCPCRRLRQTGQDPDGCYRCLRTYFLQYQAPLISREKAIVVLSQLLEAGQKRMETRRLGDHLPQAAFESQLERRFIDTLRRRVESSGGVFQEALVQGGKGYVFTLEKPRLSWEIQLQARLGPKDGVRLECIPDFLIRGLQDDGLPIAVFLDGFQPHAKPGKPQSGLPDDIAKRRSILRSGRFHVWTLTWEDLDSDSEKYRWVQDRFLDKLASNGGKTSGWLGSNGQIPFSGAMDQIFWFLKNPSVPVWRGFVHGAFSFVSDALQFAWNQNPASQISISKESMEKSMATWFHSGRMEPTQDTTSPDWVVGTRLANTEDLVLLVPLKPGQAFLPALRLETNPEARNHPEFRKRWRAFWSALNLFQFSPGLRLGASEEQHLDWMDIAAAVDSGQRSAAWNDALERAVSSLRTWLEDLATHGLEPPKVEYYSADLGQELFAEAAWPERRRPLAILMGDQAGFARTWQDAGWKVVTEPELASQGAEWLANQLREE